MRMFIRARCCMAGCNQIFDTPLSDFLGVLEKAYDLRHTTIVSVCDPCKDKVPSEMNWHSTGYVPVTETGILATQRPENRQEVIQEYPIVGRGQDGMC